MGSNNPFEANITENSPGDAGFVQGRDQRPTNVGLKQFYKMIYPTGTGKAIFQPCSIAIGGMLVKALAQEIAYPDVGRICTIITKAGSHM